MEETLQHKETTQCIGVSTASTRSHNSYGTEAHYALTFKLDQLDEADQSRNRLTMVLMRQTLPHNFDLQMAKPVITSVDSNHLTVVIFSSRIWFPDSNLRDNASHQTARCYIEGWV